MIRSLPSRLALSVALAVVGASAALAAPPDAKVIEAFTQRPAFETGVLSPDGAHVAFIVPIEDKAVLAVFRRSDLKQVGVFNMAGKTRVADVWWVSPQRLIFSVARQDGVRDTPSSTGELVAMDLDGKKDVFLTGVRSYEKQTGTNIRKRDNVDIFAQVIGRMPGKDDQMLVASTRTALDVADTMIDRIDVHSGIRTMQTRAPVPYAQVLTDRDGQARFAAGATRANIHQLHYRAGPDADWRKINDEAESGVIETAVGFDAAQSVAYLVRQNRTGPDSLMAYSLADGKRTEVLRDARVDPSDFLFAQDDRTLLAVEYRDPRPRWRFIDTTSPVAKTLQSLTRSFPDHHIDFSGVSNDGNQALVYARSAVDSGAFYLFDAVKKTADELIVAQPWLDPAAMSPVQPIEFTSRDGMPMQALLTLPKSLPAGAKAPLVVMPHGGPFGVADRWEFDTESQLLAAHGFAVLRVNFRGSANYGREFQLKGYKQWGGTMQSDLADATREVIARGLVERERVCIYGASYGGYAALMGPVRDAGLYKCAAGYVGVYDLPLAARGDGNTRLMMTKAWMADALGTDRAALEAASPTLLAAQVKVPVFLAAAGLDETVDKRHSEQMRAALTAAGNAPDWLMFEGEGHGYYTVEHEREFYTRLVAFLDKHLSH